MLFVWPKTSPTVAQYVLADWPSRSHGGPLRRSSLPGRPGFVTKYSAGDAYGLWGSNGLPPTELVPFASAKGFTPG